MATDIREETEQSQAPRRQVGPGALLLYYCVAHRVWAKDRSPITRYRDAWAFCLNGCGTGHDWRQIEPITYSNLWSFGPTFLDQSASLSR